MQARSCASDVSRSEATSCMTSRARGGRTPDSSGTQILGPTNLHATPVRDSAHALVSSSNRRLPTPLKEAWTTIARTGASIVTSKLIPVRRGGGQTRGQQTGHAPEPPIINSRCRNMATKIRRVETDKPGGREELPVWLDEPVDSFAREQHSTSY